MEKSDRCIVNENVCLEEIQVNEDEDPASYPAKHPTASFQQSKLNRLLSTVSTVSQSITKSGLKGWLILSVVIIWILILIVSIVIVIYIALFHTPS